MPGSPSKLLPNLQFGDNKTIPIAEAVRVWMIPANFVLDVPVARNS